MYPPTQPQSTTAAMKSLGHPDLVPSAAQADTLLPASAGGCLAGTSSEKKCPQSHVKPVSQATGRKPRLLNPGNGPVLDPATTPTPRSHGRRKAYRASKTH